MDLSKLSVLKEKKRNEYKWHSRKDRWILREVHFYKKCFKTDEESVRLMSISNCKNCYTLHITYQTVMVHIFLFLYIFLVVWKSFPKWIHNNIFFSKSPLTKFVTMAWARIWTWSEPSWLHCQLGRWRHQ